MGRRKKEPKSVHRENIASAATILFVEKGVSATTMDEIAKAAGYSKATLYVYFMNKEEIFFSLVYQHMESIYATIEKIVMHQAHSIEEYIRNYLEICFSIASISKEHPIYFEGMIGNIPVDIDAANTPVIYKEIYELGLDLTGLIKQVIENGIDLGYIDPNTDAEKMMIFLWSSLSGIVRMAENKREYYELLGLDNKEFLQYEFLSLLNCCKKI